MKGGSQMNQEGLTTEDEEEITQELTELFL